MSSCGSIASISRPPRYFRSPSESGARADMAALTLCARSRPNALQQIWSLLDHLVGEREEGGRDGNAEHLGSVEINDELEFGCLHNREVARALPLENATGIDASLSVSVRDTGAIAHQAAYRRKLTQTVKRRKRMSGCKRNHFLAMRCQH